MRYSGRSSRSWTSSVFQVTLRSSPRTCRFRRTFYLIACGLGDLSPMGFESQISSCAHIFGGLAALRRRLPCCSSSDLFRTSIARDCVHSCERNGTRWRSNFCQHKRIIGGEERWTFQVEIKLKSILKYDNLCQFEHSSVLLAYSDQVVKYPPGA